VSLALHLLTDFGAWVRVGFTTKYLSTNIQRLLCCCRDLHDRRLVCAATKYQDQLVSILNHLLLTQLMRVGGCSFAENAESECERMVNEAMTIDQSNPEVYQVAASLRISQQRNVATHSGRTWILPKSQSINREQPLPSCSLNCHNYHLRFKYEPPPPNQQTPCVMLYLLIARSRSSSCVMGLARFWMNWLLKMTKKSSHGICYRSAIQARIRMQQRNAYNMP
jgi:hypothetical protein